MLGARFFVNGRANNELRIAVDGPSHRKTFGEAGTPENGAFVDGG